MNFILGDFNAEVGIEETRNVTGSFGLGNRNERGERLVEFCQEKRLQIMNTLFSLPPRRLYTWKSPQDNDENIIKTELSTRITSQLRRVRGEENIWQYTKTILYDSAKNILGTKKYVAKQRWMTPEILQLMDQRQLRKSKDAAEYKHHRGQIIIDSNERTKLWEEYVKKLFEHCERSTHLQISTELSGPPITMDEIKSAIRSSENKKAVGPDDIPAEIN
ncbi:uncharacterized protein LOC129605874 [Condylostylus longicornis]|uniref:uncharacterized protein LOC129605874 n=1 Tax=Condylostylus longicornis TaxID=2530218 RepID=UPI00244E1D7E|nr:uncharacterized protein LOC129605874 [Condylostylus longicornis]